MADPDRTRRDVIARWIALVVFGVGFGYVEAAVVSYLRQVVGIASGYDAGVERVYVDLGFIAFMRPAHPVLVDARLTQVETVREAATLLVLLAVGFVAGESLRSRAAAFFVAFTAWDLTYYLFLRVIDGWPASLMDRDVFFLIPVTWVGPVATAVVASAVVLVVASWAYLSGGNPYVRARPRAGRSRRL